MNVVIHSLIRGLESMPYLYMQQILLLSAGSSIPTFILMQRDDASLLETWIRKVLHFIVTIAAIIALPTYFDWNNQFAIVISFIVVYIAALIMWEMQPKRLANQINERIVEINKEKFKP
ncbi:MAG: DUF3021 family protein [Defluviitaleaceae bacterium]|nr:DUF3021 family protein [Defluviitaleaceae bacterium]